MSRVAALTGCLVLLLCPRAQAYVDPVSSQTGFNILSLLFIVGSAAFIFLKNQCVRLCKGLWRLFGRVFR